MDPGGWRVGQEPCTHLVVKDANLRLQAARATLAGYLNPVRCPLRPALREAGLRAPEDRWRATLAGRGLLARLAPPAAGGPRTRRDPAFDAPWMHQPPTRPAPAQRAAARCECADRAARRQPLPDDTIDPLNVAERRPA